MTRKKSSTLTERELGIMKIVWELGTATVREIYEALRGRQEMVAYTTVMTMMNILEEKSYLQKTRESRAYVYEPVQPRSEVISGMVQEFVDRVFNGSARPLVLNLLEERKLSEKELLEISRMIQEDD